MQRLPPNACLLLISITSCARAVQLGGQFTNQSAPSLLQALGKVGPAVQELFTTNAVCSKSNCINPVFPGLEDLHALAHSSWTCTSLAKIKESMQFCQPVIDYDPALQAGSGQTIDELALKQDGAAASAFFYHLSGLGYDAWDHTEPGLTGDDCIKAMWRMACFTYFPRAQMGCVDGNPSLYLRPCQSSCQNYIRKCGVECCDESVQCVFTHQVTLSNNAVVMTEGYAPHDGPSSMCTGAASRRFGGIATALGLPVLLMLAELFLGSSASPRERRSAPLPFGVFARLATSVLKSPLLPCIVIALTLQGCLVDDIFSDVPTHTIGNWRQEPDYLMLYEFVPPAGNALDAKLNSCSLAHLAENLQCSGRGVCKQWSTKGDQFGKSFCECDRDYADPECVTKRKSQAIAYFLSLFFGFAGADQFYLGFYRQAIVKLFTFGGFGLVWVVDMIRIGSGPVHTQQFRVAEDLPRWVFTLTAAMVAILLGVAIAVLTASNLRATRQKGRIISAPEVEEAHMTEPEPVPNKASAFSAPAYTYPASFAPGPVHHSQFAPAPMPSYGISPYGAVSTTAPHKSVVM